MSNVPSNESASTGRVTPAARPARSRRVALFLAMAAVVVVLDQWSKAAMTKLLSDGSRHVLIPHVMDLYLVHNTGAAFSMGEGSGWLFVLIALAAFVLALRFVWGSRDATLPLAAVLGLIVGGGIGNMIDRLLLGSVTDFLATSFIRFPVFNVADIAVTCGVFVMLVLVWRMDAGEEEGE